MDRLLLIDRDETLGRALAEQLGGLGYAVERTASGAEALTQAGQRDLLIVAGTGPDIDTAALCDAWCGAGAGILILTDGDDADAAAMQAAGATTLAKPVRLGDLVRAVKDALRGSAAPDFAIGGLRFHPATRELAGAGTASVRLTEKEAAILAYLHRSGDRAVPRDELLAQIWGYADAIATHTLETHIYRLRRKLASHAAAPRLLSEDNGYRLAIEKAVSDQASVSNPS